MYLGMTLMLGALAVAMGTAPFYVATIGYAVVLDRVFCSYEEQKALVEFGDEYATYTKRVRRWL
jgi:protein-S-isoprenylcysteine O-methyltransferase Ste14